MIEKVFDKAYAITTREIPQSTLTRAANRLIAEYIAVFGDWGVPDEITAMAEKIKQGIDSDDYGAPTKRKRFFMIARCDGKPIVWPTPTHAPKERAKSLGLKPYRSAAEIIDWSIPCPSIFERKKPLTEATMRRIARGLKKFVFDEKKPFIVPIGYGENKNQLPRVHSIDEPMPTLVGSGKHYLISPMLVDYHFNNESKSVEEPHNTITTVRGNYLCEAFLAKHFGGGYKGSGADIKEPLPTVTSVDHNALVEVKLSGHDHVDEVTAFLVKYYKGEDNLQSLNDSLHTITSKSRFGLITVNKVQYRIADIGMRMLTPRELYNAQGFPEDYIIDKDFSGKKYSISKQIARCGNAVPPPFAEALARANLSDQQAGKSFRTMHQLQSYTEQLSLFEAMI